MWGVYGDEHKGVALAFRPQLDGGRPSIPLLGVTGSSWVAGQPLQYTRGSLKGILEPVTYSERAPELEFFQSLGNLPKGKLERAWHTNRAGERSTLVDGMLSDLPSWRTAYFDLFRRIATTKLPDWKHEEEYRIFMPDALGMHADNEHRLVQYDFSSLEGIVFGIRTSEVHKLELIKQISSQCEKVGRTDFAFYQMAYNATKGHLIRV